MMNSKHRYDVAIVGAGPVGLATAIGLHRRGVRNMVVLEQAQAFRRVGQVVDLLPNGLKALRCIDQGSYADVQELDVSVRPERGNKSMPEASKEFWRHRNLQGEILRSVPLNRDDWRQRYGEGRVSVDWFTLQKTLRDQLPAHLIQVAHRCVDLTEESDGVELTCITREKLENPYAHWEMTKPAIAARSGESSPQIEVRKARGRHIHARIVIGADGIHSTIRRLIYPEMGLTAWSEPRYSGFTAVGCFKTNASSDLYTSLDDAYLRGERIVTVQKASDASSTISSPRIILTRKPDQSLGYLLHTPMAEGAVSNLPPTAVIKIAMEALSRAGFPMMLVELVSASDPDQLLHRAYYYHPADIASHAEPIWSKGRIVLAGDAAHGMPPFTAQGANQGFEDAAILGTLLAETINQKLAEDPDSLAHVFRHYEQIRRPFMIEMQAAVLRSQDWSQEEWEYYNERVYLRDFSIPLLE